MSTDARLTHGWETRIKKLPQLDFGADVHLTLLIVKDVFTESLALVLGQISFSTSGVPD